jgi:hypothetical protein
LRIRLGLIMAPGSQHHRGARLGESVRRRGADAAAGTRYDCNFSGKAWHHTFSDFRSTIRLARFPTT